MLRQIVNLFPEDCVYIVEFHVTSLVSNESVAVGKRLLEPSSSLRLRSKAFTGDNNLLVIFLKK